MLPPLATVKKLPLPSPPLRSHRETNGQQLAEKIVEKQKQIYSRRHKLDPGNSYERLFSNLNTKILSEIHLSRQRRQFVDAGAVYSVQVYQQLYSDFSKRLLAKFRKSIKRHRPGSIDELTFVRRINPQEIALAAERLRDTQDRSEIAPRLYDYDPLTKERILERKKKENFSKEIARIIAKQRVEPKENPFKHLKFVKEDKQTDTVEKYSKGAYLMSLNFNLSNPLA